MMALYGEHFYLKKLLQALNTLNNQTVALDVAIKPHLQEQLGS